MCFDKIQNFWAKKKGYSLGKGRHTVQKNMVSGTLEIT